MANFVVNDPELSKEFRVRGITREPSKLAMKALESKGVEIVKGDVLDEASVQHAIQGAHSIFLMTSSGMPKDLLIIVAASVLIVISRVRPKIKAS